MAGGFEKLEKASEQILPERKCSEINTALSVP